MAFFRISVEEIGFGAAAAFAGEGAAFLEGVDFADFLSALFVALLAIVDEEMEQRRGGERGIREREEEKGVGERRA